MADPPPTRRGATAGSATRVLVLLTMLLLGAASTIAVAWGCRWGADERYWTEVRARNEDMRPDAHPTWGQQHGPWRETTGHDGRRILRVGNGTDFELFGVEWLVVQSRDSIDAMNAAGIGGWTTGRSSSPGPRVWNPMDPSVVPWWSTIDQHALTEHSAVIESAAGWPFPALMARHWLPKESLAWHPLQRTSHGAVEGIPYDDERIVLLPVQPIASGFAANTALHAVLWSAVIGGGIGVVTLVRRRVRRRRARCLWCAHRQIDRGRDTCPECGRDPRRAPAPWRAVIGTGAALTALLVVLEGIVLVAVQHHPVVPPLMQAAYDGDIAALQRQAAATPSPPSGVWLAAAFGEQVESLRAIAAIEGHPAPTAGAPMSRALFEDLCFIAPYCRAAFLADVFDAFGWSVVSTTGAPSLVMSERQPRFTLPHGWHDELAARMRRDSAFHAMFWPSYVRCFIQYGSNDVARAVLDAGVPADLSAADRASLLAHCRQAGGADFAGVSSVRKDDVTQRELYDAICALLESAP